MPCRVGPLKQGQSSAGDGLAATAAKVNDQQMKKDKIRQLILIGFEHLLKRLGQPLLQKDQYFGQLQYFSDAVKLLKQFIISNV